MQQGTSTRLQQTLPQRESAYNSVLFVRLCVGTHNHCSRPSWIGRSMAEFERILLRWCRECVAAGAADPQRAAAGAALRVAHREGAGRQAAHRRTRAAAGRPLHLHRSAQRQRGRYGFASKLVCCSMYMRLIQSDHAVESHNMVKVPSRARNLGFERTRTACEGWAASLCTMPGPASQACGAPFNPTHSGTTRHHKGCSGPCYEALI